MIVHVRGMLAVECECLWWWCKLWTEARHALCVMICTFCRIPHMFLMLPRICMATRLAEMNMVCVRTLGKTIPTVGARSERLLLHPLASDHLRVHELRCLLNLGT